jgi:thiol-disulfide isomerase/thioredoxin
MLERLLFAIALLALAFAVYCLVRRYHLARAAQTAPVDPLLNSAPQGIPMIVYFTTPQCIPCKTQQQPTLHKLKHELGEALHIVQVDTTQDPEAAQRWGVMTAPTTFILSKDGKPQHVNYGVADLLTLKRQLGVA